MEQQMLDGMYEQLGISKEVLDYAADIEESLKERFEGIDQVAEYNQLKVLKGMQDNKVSDIHFAATTGYGYNDAGVIHWKMYMPVFSILKAPHTVPAYLPELMHCILPCPKFTPWR